MKYLLVCLSLVLFSTLPLEAKHKRNPKYYIKDDDVYFFPHGIYIAEPGKLHRIRCVWYSHRFGLYTYRKFMRFIPLSKVSKIFPSYHRSLSFSRDITDPTEIHDALFGVVP